MWPRRLGGVPKLMLRSPVRVTLRTVAPIVRNLSMFLPTVTCPLAKSKHLPVLPATRLNVTGMGDVPLRVVKKLLHRLILVSSGPMERLGNLPFLARETLKMATIPKVGMATLPLLPIIPFLWLSTGPSALGLTPLISPPIPQGVGVKTPTFPLFPPIRWLNLPLYRWKFTIKPLFRTVTRTAPPKSQLRNPDTVARNLPQWLSLKTVRMFRLKCVATLPIPLVGPLEARTTGMMGWGRRGLVVRVLVRRALVVLTQVPLRLLCLGRGQSTTWHLLGILCFLNRCLYLLLSLMTQLHLANVFPLRVVVPSLKAERLTLFPYLLGTRITLDRPKQQLFKLRQPRILGTRMQKLMPQAKLTIRLTPVSLPPRRKVVPSPLILVGLSRLSCVVRKPSLLMLVVYITLQGKVTRPLGLLEQL